ncbi:hypothetical protein D3C84_1180200 [compost metagenome]
MVWRIENTGISVEYGVQPAARTVSVFRSLLSPDCSELVRSLLGCNPATKATTSFLQPDTAHSASVRAHPLQSREEHVDGAALLAPII